MFDESKETNATLADEQSMAAESFTRRNRVNEDENKRLEVDIKSKVANNKKLQEFFDKYDKILQEQQTSSQTEIISLRKEKDDMEASYKKELDIKTTALETLEGEFQVKMMKIRLMELELENKLTDTAEAQEQKDADLSDLRKDNKKYSAQVTQMTGNIAGLTKNVETLRAEIKMLNGGGEEDEEAPEDQDQADPDAGGNSESQYD